jgi:hypothetical protein
MAARKLPVHPAIVVAAAKRWAVNRAARKAGLSPGRLTAADVGRLPGRTVAKLASGGKIKHLGIGTRADPAP